MAYESCSFHSEPTTNHVQEMEEENAYYNIEVQHRPSSEPQHSVPVANREKSKSFIFVAVVSVTLFVILGLALGGLILVLQEKSRLDETKKVYETDASELREENRKLSETDQNQLTEMKESYRLLQQIIQSQVSKQNQTNNNLRSRIQESIVGQNQTHVKILRELRETNRELNKTFLDALSAMKANTKSFKSCAELIDKYGVSQSGIYELRKNGSYNTVYSYCDFKLRTGNDTCENLLNEVGTGFEDGYFWIRDEDQSTQPSFKYCFKGSSSCKELVWMKRPTSGGIFTIYPILGSKTSKELYCDQDGWTVFQRRINGSVDFYRGWNDYRNGFGHVNGEFWLGLETIYQLTKDGTYELRVELEDFDGNKAYAEYGYFSIADASDYYRLNVSFYSGNAGDSLEVHNGMKFSTKDKDNDLFHSNCAKDINKGAWWYNGCVESNLNGKYHTSKGDGNNLDGIEWRSWRHKEYLKSARMKFRKNKEV